MNDLIKYITFVPPPASKMQNKVIAIKAIRQLCGIGLKEAKDAAELEGIRQTFQLSKHSFSSYSNPALAIEEQMRLLRNEGFEVGPSINKILQGLRELATEALAQGEDEIANEILQLVLAEKLRRQTDGSLS